MLSKETLNELRIILLEEFNYEMNDSDLENFAKRLIGLFEMLMRLESESEVRKVSSTPS